MAYAYRPLCCSGFATHRNQDKRSIAESFSESLLICLDTGSYARKMCHLDLADISSDKQLFSSMRQLYRTVRFNRIADHFRPTAIQAIRFVQFTLRRIHMVDNLALGVMPKAEDDEYIFTPKPASPTWQPPGVRWIIDTCFISCLNVQLYSRRMYFA